jgi:lysyl-tRNA synthetase class 2
MATPHGHRETRRKFGHRRPASRMQLQLKDSSSIAAAEYDHDRRVLRLRFSPGAIYDYLDVPADVVREFLNAPSLGRFVNWRIKPRYRYVLVAPPPPTPRARRTG